MIRCSDGQYRFNSDLRGGVGGTEGQQTAAIRTLTDALYRPSVEGVRALCWLVSSDMQVRAREPLRAGDGPDARPSRRCGLCARSAPCRPTCASAGWDETKGVGRRTIWNAAGGASEVQARAHARIRLNRQFQLLIKYRSIEGQDRLFLAVPHRGYIVQQQIRGRQTQDSGRGSGSAVVPPVRTVGILRKILLSGRACNIA